MPIFIKTETMCTKYIFYLNKFPNNLFMGVLKILKLNVHTGCLRSWVQKVSIGYHKKTYLVNIFKKQLITKLFDFRSNTTLKLSPWNRMLNERVYIVLGRDPH